MVHKMSFDIFGLVRGFFNFAFWQKEVLMFRKVVILVVMGVLFVMSSCGGEENASKVVNFPYEGGGGKSFKIPVPKGYDWEVSQSWGKHCETCDERYPSDDVSYCESSHTDKCCEFGWDFNLPGNADNGKPVLATADGHVQEVASEENGGWGNTVILNHGDNICSRYAHLLGNSIKVEEGQQVCQGMEIAAIGDSGNSSGSHLHFQFENCQTGDPLERGFNDGNGIPLCTRGEDRYDNAGNYIALKLTNSLRENCEEEEVFGGEELPGNGWISASCGAFSGCPMITNCGRGQNHRFSDSSVMETRVEKAAMYLYGECAVDGKNDGSFHPNDTLTRAEALKIPMYLFGLTSNCGSDEPFADVDSSDWFFGVVACGVRYGLLEHASNFDPNEEVTFSQAAKFVVMAAAEASVIDIQSPAQGHFPGIGKDHWAYEYVETLYFYGGLLRSPEKYSSGQKMKRGEYALMVASLSSCFCENVVCENGCRCDQEMFACRDSSNDLGIGGERSSGDNPAEEDFEPDNLEWEDLIEINCEVDPTHSSCENTSTLLYIKCSLRNNGDRELFLNDMSMTLIPGSYSGNCEVIDGTLQTGVGVQTVNPGESKDLNGHYEILCSSLSGEELEVSFDLKERLSGNTVLYDEVGIDFINTAVSELPNCEETSPDTCEPFHCWVDWICIPEEPYNVHIHSSGGEMVEVLTFGGEHLSYWITAQTSWEFSYSFPCDELPLTILLTAGPSGAEIGITPLAYPPSAFYFNYAGEITHTPSMSPSNISTHEEFTDPYAKMLIRIPF